MRGNCRFLLRNSAVLFVVAACAMVFTACEDPTGLPTFTVAFNLNGGTGVPPPQQTVDAGSSFALPIGTGLFKDGHTFGGWNTAADGSGTNFSAGAQFTPTRDLTLFARWVAGLPVTVSFDSNGGTGAVSALSTISGSPVTLPSGAGFSRTGFVFGGWNTNAAGTGINHEAGAAFTPIGNVTLYARWVPAFTVMFNSNGGGGVVPAQSVGQGSSMLLPSGVGLSKSGYTFDGWNESPTGSGLNHHAGSFFTPPGNMTLFARWVHATAFTVTFNANGGMGTAPPPVQVNRDASISLPGSGGLSRIGFAFGGWNTQPDGGGERFGAGSLFASNADTTLFAMWDPVPIFRVGFDANGGSGSPPPPQTVNQGSSIQLPGGGGLSRDGLVFGGWNTNAGGTGMVYGVGVMFTPTEDTTLYAHWTDVFTVSFHANGGTGPLPPPQTAAPGSTTEIPGSGGLSRPGHVFGGWNTEPDGSGRAFAAGESYTPTGSITLFVMWIPEGDFTVSFHANGGSGTLPAPRTAAAGSSIPIPGDGGLSRAGFSFGGWNTEADGSGRNFSEGDFFMPTGDTVLFARWNPVVTFTVSFAANGGAGTAPAPQTVAAGYGITLPDGGGLSRAGFTFGGWNENAAGTGVNRNAGAQFTPTGNTTLYARWLALIVNFTVTFDLNDGDGAVPAPQTVAEGGSVTLPSGAGLSRTGFTFGGWNTNAAGTGTNHDGAATFFPSGNITLFVNWVPGGADNITVPGSTLAARLSWLGTHAQAGGNYIVMVNDNESLTPAQAALPSGRDNITIILRAGAGAMRTISLSANGNLFTVAGGLTLVLEGNLTLNGRVGNHRALVEVMNRGTLLMHEGARIIGNANSSTSLATEGGGVRVNSGGVFNMQGGEVSGNGSARDGGGVFNNGTFRISKGLIQGNAATRDGAALFNNGTAQRGSFGTGGAFSPAGNLSTSDGTIRVANGELQ